MPATDPTFYRSPAAAVSAAPEQIAYVAAFDPAGRRLACASGDKTVRVWDLDTGQELHHFASQTESFGSVAFSPDGRLLAGGQGDLDVMASNRAPGAMPAKPSSLGCPAIRPATAVPRPSQSARPSVDST